MISIQHVVAFLCMAYFVSSGVVNIKSDTGTVTIHATNKTKTPSVHYIVDAVECLKESYAIYTIDEDIANLYIALYQEKHPEFNWNVVVGYTAVVLNSDIYVETAVTGGKSKDKKDKVTDKNFLIFSAGPTTNPPTSAPCV